MRKKPWSGMRKPKQQKQNKEYLTKKSEEILAIVRDNWERLAKEYGLSRGQIENMRPAFNACYDI